MGRTSSRGLSGAQISHPTRGCCWKSAFSRGLSAVVFSSTASGMEIFPTLCRIAPYFKIFSSDFRLRKPHPDIFIQAANLAGHAPEDCVYIGDRYMEDVQGPKGIGMPAILKIKEGRVYPDEMPEADRRIETLSDLLEHFEI